LGESTSSGLLFLNWVKTNWGLLLFLIILVSAFILLRSQPSNIGSASELEAILTDGEPVVLEFYSNF
jgi:hypothetical protein